jgi:hypothetical protein
MTPAPGWPADVVAAVSTVPFVRYSDFVGGAHSTWVAAYVRLRAAGTQRELLPDGAG